MKNLYTLVFLLLLSSCNPTKFSQTSSSKREPAAETVAEPAAVVQQEVEKKNCLYKNQTVAHNAEADFFLASTVAYDQVCNAVKRTCFDGQFQGNKSAAYESCVPAAARACIFGTETVKHNDSITVASSATLPYGQACEYKQAKCTDGRFSIDTQVYKYKNCVTDTLQTKAFNVQASFSSTPFKLLIVVDNSYTMKHTQEKLSQNVESLLRPLAGKNVDVRIVSTSPDQNVNHSDYLKFERQDGTTYSRYDRHGINGTLEYSDRNIATIELLRSFTEHDFQSSSFSLSNLDSAEGTEKKINDIKTKILAMGINGSDDESGLCAIYRYLNSHKFTTESFFRPGDKSAVVLLSDEDDASFTKANNCTKTYSAKAYWRTVPPNFYYQYYAKVQSIRVKYSFETVYDAVYKDNNLVSPARTETRTDGMAYLSNDQATDEEIQSGVCAERAQAALRSRGDNVKNWSGSHYWNSENWSKAVVSSCERVISAKGYHIFAVHYPSSLSDANSCSSGVVQTQFGLKNLTEAEFEGMPTYDMNPMPNSNVFGQVRFRYHSECQRETHGTTTETIERHVIKGSEPQSWNYYLSDVPAESRQQIVFDAAKALFGSDFYMSFLVNPLDSSCKLEAGQSAGTIYHQFASLSKNMSTYPICSASYAPALELVQNFIQTVTVARYPLGLSSAARVISVSKGGALINSSDWEYKGGELILKGSLTAGDQIQVAWAPR